MNEEVVICERIELAASNLEKRAIIVNSRSIYSEVWNIVEDGLAKHLKG